MKLTLTTDEWNDLESEHGEHMRADYSGRGMWGEECLGYTGPEPMLFALDLACVLAERDGDGQDMDTVRQVLVDTVGHPVTDSMGLGTIVHYWPNIAVTDEAKPDE